MRNYGKKDIIIGIGFIVAVAIIVISAMILPNFFRDSSLSKMKPIPVSENPSPDYGKVDFSKKASISLNKYGFREKIVVKEHCIVTQDVGGPKNPHAYFGIFLDEKLEEPIEVVDFTWLYKDGPFEEGEVGEPPYDKARDGIIILEPGTYYAAIYTTNPFARFEASYTSSYCPLSEGAILKEGEALNYFNLDKKQKNTYKIVAEKDGVIRIKTGIYYHGTVNVFDQNQKRIFHADADESKKPIDIIKIPVRKGKTYHVATSNLEAGREANNMSLYSIKYQY